MLFMVGEQQVREMFGEFDCGCQNREEIMGADNWQLDAGVIVGAAVLALIALVVLKSS
jgi:hypothetical protein